MSLESELYPKIKKYVETHFDCRHVAMQVGTRLGKIDVVGLKDIHGDLETRTEIIAVEVKEEGARFLNALGQALAYSVYAHSCYLAVRKRGKNSFTQEEKEVAAHFGVGLLEIKSADVAVTATSRYFAPDDRYVMQILKGLNYFRCSLCRGVYPRKEVTELNSKDQIRLADTPSYTGALSKAIREGRHAAYYLYDLAAQMKDKRDYVWDRRYLCRDCISIFASLLQKQ